jgi:hypothetical protein
MGVNKRHRNGNTMRDADRKRAFGLQPKDRWPAAGLPLRIIETGWGPVIHEVRSIGDPLHQTKRKGRRAVAHCPKCATWVCAGHLGQHIAKHYKEDPNGNEINNRQKSTSEETH